MDVAEVIDNVGGKYIPSGENESVKCNFKEITIYEDGFWKGCMEIEANIEFEPMMKGAIELEDGRTGEIYISTESDNGHILFVGAESDGGPK